MTVILFHFLDVWLCFFELARDLFDVHEDLENDDMENYLEDKLKSLFFHQSMIDEDEYEDVSWFRDDIPRTTIDTSAMDNY